MADTRLNIFDFNHIDTTLSKGTVDMLKNLYSYYHMKHHGYEKLHCSYQIKNLQGNIITSKAVVTSAVAGGITLNPTIFAPLTAIGLMVKIIATAKKNYIKIELANTARTKYKKILNEIRFYLRGKPFNKKAFLDWLKMINDFISDRRFPPS